MLPNQPLKTLTTIPSQTQGEASTVLKAVEMGELVLSVSTMLGCDYVFINHIRLHALLAPQRLHRTIRELLDMLDTSPQQSLIISVDEHLKFTRYEYTWENRKVIRITPNQIHQQEQIDFIQMMFDCSSAC